MPPTLQSLLDRTELGLRAVVDAEPGRALRWVHVSELDDPTPYLEGDELLLTTGLLFEAQGAHWDAYVARLVDRGVGGLGFGVGLRHTVVPPDLVAAATSHGLPVLVVPKDTPFIAISKAVAAALEQERQRALTGALNAQRDLIRAALSQQGPREVVTKLAAAVRGWVLLLDSGGNLRACAPADARRHVARVRMDLDRLHVIDPLRSASLAIGDDAVAVLPLGVHGQVGGFLVAGRPDALTAPELSVVNMAVGLLSLDVTGGWDLRESDRRAAAAVLRLAAGGNADLAVELAGVLGVSFPDPPLRVAVLGAPLDGLPQLIRAAEGHQGLRVVSAIVAEQDADSVVVLLSAAHGDTTCLEEVLAAVPQSRGVVSDPVTLTDLPDSWRRTRSVFYGSPGRTGRLLIAKDVASAGLLRHLDSPDAQGWAASLLEPLDRHASRSKLALIATLRVFLAHNGQIDASATALGIHRHTLRYRLNKIAELLDRDLDDPTVRAELWLALRMRELG